MMLKAGVDADTISYITVIRPCAEARDVAKAEPWLCMMLKAGVEVDTVSCITVTKACAKAREPKQSTGCA